MTLSVYLVHPNENKSLDRMAIEWLEPLAIGPLLTMAVL
jgi:hypothetical protein